MPYTTGNKTPRKLIASIAAARPSLRDLLKSEPLRARAYALTVLVAVYLVARGVIDATDRDFVVSVVAVVLGVESSRAKVTPAE